LEGFITVPTLPFPGISCRCLKFSSLILSNPSTSSFVMSTVVFLFPEFILLSSSIIHHHLSCTFRELGPLASSESELTSETVNPFRHFDRIPWTGDRPITAPVPTQDSTTQKTHPYICLRSGFEPSISMYARSLGSAFNVGDKTGSISTVTELRAGRPRFDSW
jgi:hypothetical protein